MGPGWVRVLLFGVGSGSVIKMLVILPSGFRFLRVKVRIGFGSGSAFRGRVGFGDQNVEDFPLGFLGP